MKGALPKTSPFITRLYQQEIFRSDGYDDHPGPHSPTWWAVVMRMSAVK